MKKIVVAAFAVAAISIALLGEHAVAQDESLARAVRARACRPSSEKTWL